MLLLVLLAVSSVLWPSSLQQIKALTTHLLFLSTTMTFSVDSIGQLQQFILTTLRALGLPFALAAISTIILSTVVQTGFVWSSQALGPDFKRLNIAQGFKRLFSSKLL